MNEIESILKEMLEQVTEFRNNYVSNEQAVRTQLIEPILNVLGWKTSNPKFVRPNAPDEDGKVPDYTLVKNGKTTLIVEAKNLSINLQDKKIIDQLANYCFKSGIDFGILTNGMKWLLFKTFEKNPTDRIIWQVDVENDKIELVAQNLASFSYVNIDILDQLLKKGKILDTAWKSIVESTGSITMIISKKVLETIKLTNPNFTIDPHDLKTFTEGKIIELFEANNEDEEENGKVSPIKSESEFADVENAIFKRKKILEKISVTFPDKTIIKHKKVVDTFVEVIKRIGPEKILPLNLYRAGVAIVSEKEDDFYHQHKIGKYWIMVNTSTKEKIALLKEINNLLNLELIIEIFTNEK